MTRAHSERPAILLVEDSDNDAELTMIALADAQLANPIVRVEDGVQALEYLNSRTPDDLPSVVLLDINLPRLSGLEVLKAIRTNDLTTLVPVVMLTSSREDQDRLEAYRHRANSYIQKPVQFEAFAAAVRHLGLYWVVLNLSASGDVARRDHPR